MINEHEHNLHSNDVDNALPVPDEAVHDVSGVDVDDEHGVEFAPVVLF